MNNIQLNWLRIGGLALNKHHHHLNLKYIFHTSTRTPPHVGGQCVASSPTTNLAQVRARNGIYYISICTQLYKVHSNCSCAQPGSKMCINSSRAVDQSCTVNADLGEVMQVNVFANYRKNIYSYICIDHMCAISILDS